VAIVIVVGLSALEAEDRIGVTHEAHANLA
jgi:hypothetical protein